MARSLQFCAYLLAGNFLANGFLHFVMGILGKKFVKCPKTVSEKSFRKVYAGPLFSSAVFNATYGLIHFALAFLIVYGIGSFRFGWTAEAGALSLGFILGSLQLAWKYEGTIS
jgi:hypothetical protein